jgi:hypothetical protein
MALTALNIAALPVIAGLMAGTGAMGAYVVGPKSTPASVSAPASFSAPIAVAAPQAKPCEAQTWPYIESRCVTASAQQNRKVRFVMAPRDGVSDVPAPEVSGTAPAAAPLMDARWPAASEQLVTRETVGRSFETAPPAVMPGPPVSKRTEKPRGREEGKLARQAYQVPSEAAGGRRDRRPVIVVRPLRLGIFR